MAKGKEKQATERKKKGAEEPEYVLRLFVAGESRKSRRAIENIQQICHQNLSDRYELEVIDILQEPGKADEEDIVAVPTLVRKLPPPLRKLVGDLSRTDKVLVGLDLESME